MRVLADFFLRGVLPSGEEDGLELVTGYIVRQMQPFSCHYGSCQPRGRLYFLVLKTQNHMLMDTIVHVVTVVFRDAIAEHGGPVDIHELMKLVDSLAQLPKAVLPPEAERHLSIQDQRSVI